METTIKKNGLRIQFAVLMVAIGSIMISFSSVFVKLSEVGPITSGFYRVFFGSLILLPLGLFYKGSLNIGWRNFFLVVTCGFVFALDLTVWHKSIHGVGPGLATVLANLQVFVLSIIGVFFFKENVSGRAYIAMLIAILGLGLLVGPGWHKVSGGWKWGMVFGIITAFVYANYIILLKKLQTGKSNNTQLLNIALVSFVTGIFMALEIPLTGESFVISEGKTLWSLVAYGFFGQSIGWYLISKGLPLLDISISGMILLLQPSLAFIWDILFFSRPTTVMDIIGASTVLAAIYIGVTAKKGR